MANRFTYEGKFWQKFHRVRRWQLAFLVVGSVTAGVVLTVFILGGGDGSSPPLSAAVTDAAPTSDTPATAIVPTRTPIPRMIPGVVTDAATGSDVQVQPMPAQPIIADTTRESLPDAILATPEAPQAVIIPPEPLTTPEITPTATPLPKFRPVSIPAESDIPGGFGGEPIFKFTSGPSLSYNKLTFSGTVTDQGHFQPSVVQVWQAEYDIDITNDCSTEQPIAFIQPGSGSGQSYVPVTQEYQWGYCIQGNRLPDRVNEVPWLRALQWTWKERSRDYIYEPRIWDFTFEATLADTRVQALEYKYPAGHTVVIWSGDTMLAREWLPEYK